MLKWQITQSYLLSSSHSQYFFVLIFLLLSLFGRPFVVRRLRSCCHRSSRSLPLWLDIFKCTIFLFLFDSFFASWNEKYTLNLEETSNIKGFIISKRANGNRKKSTSLRRFIFFFFFFFISFSFAYSIFSSLVCVCVWVLWDQKKNSDLCASTLVNAIFVGFHIDFPRLLPVGEERKIKIKWEKKTHTQYPSRLN